MFADNLTRDEARARAALISTSAYAVRVDLSGAQLDDPLTRFTSSSRVQRAWSRSLP